MHTISSQIRARKDALGISVANLSAKSGVSTRTLNRLLSGQDVALSHVLKISTALEMNLDFSMRATAHKVRQHQALSQAQAIVQLSQNTARLERQSLGASPANKLLKTVVHKLLRNNSRLWHPISLHKI